MDWTCMAWCSCSGWRGRSIQAKQVAQQVGSGGRGCQGWQSLCFGSSLHSARPCHETSCCHGLWAVKSTSRKNGSCVAAPCLGPVTRKWGAPHALEHGTGISAGQAGVQNRAQQPWLVPRVRTGDTQAWPQQCHPSPVHRHRAHLASRHEHQARLVSHHSQLQNDQPTT